MGRCKIIFSTIICTRTGKGIAANPKPNLE
jgi:hypothetical protein